MGIIMGALGGLGEGLADIGRRNQMVEIEKEREERQRLSNLELEKMRDENNFNRAKLLADYAEERKTAPMKRFGIIANAKANEEIPLEAAPVTEINRAGVEKAGLKDGIQGSNQDLDLIRARMQKVLDNPDQYSAEAKQTAEEILAQMGEQVRGQEQANLDAVAGKTRTRTKDEAYNAAFEEAKISDPEAAIAMSPLVREERAEKKLDAEIKYRNETQKRLEAKAEADLARRERSEMRAAEYQSAIASAKNAQEARLLKADRRKDLETNLKDLRKDLDRIDDQMKEADPATKNSLVIRRKNIEDEIGQYRGALASPNYEMPEIAKPTPTKEAIEYLTKNPNTAAMFESTYGVKADQFLTAPEVAAKPAAAAPSNVIPPAPTEKRWIGNKFVTTPEYKEWEAKYGKQKTQEEQDSNAGIIERLGKAKL